MPMENPTLSQVQKAHGLAAPWSPQCALHHMNGSVATLALSRVKIPFRQFVKQTLQQNVQFILGTAGREFARDR